MDHHPDQAQINNKAKLTEVNAYLTCSLCKGYYIDATTIVECLHSFCRSCIIQHLQVDTYCPICDLMINRVKPNIKPDKTLQDIVYKLVPGLYASEMCRRRKFWVEHPEEAQKVSCPEARGFMTERIVFSPQDAISLSIEYMSDEHTAAWTNTNLGPVLNSGSGIVGEPDTEIPLRRYLQCPAMLRVEHLKKFICNKYNVDNQLYHVDILYKRVPLPDHYTLMDIAYIYSWKRNEPMKFYFRITDHAHVSERFDYFEPSSAVSATSTPIKQPLTARCIKKNAKQPTAIVNNNNNNINKKIVPVRDEKEKEEKKDKVEETKKSDESKENIEKSDKNSDVIVENNKKDEKKCVVKIDKEDKQVKQVKVKKLKEKTENIKIIVKNKNQSEVKLKNKSDNYVDDKKEGTKKEELKTKTDLQCISNKSDNKSDNRNKVNKIEKKAGKLISETSENHQQVNKSVDKVLVTKEEKRQKEISDKKDLQPDKTVPIPPIPLLSSTPPPLSVASSPPSPTKSSLPSSPSKTPPTKPSKPPIELEDNVEKSEFLKSIQLAPKGSPPSFLRPILPQSPLAPILLPPKIISQKRKYVKKNVKDSPIAKKMKLSETKIMKSLEKIKSSEGCSNKQRKIAPKVTQKESNQNKSSSSSEEVKDINNPLVQLMVSNMNKQANSVNTIVEQFDSAKTSAANDKPQNDSLQSLIDSCRLNIPSSLSITLTETSRNEDGSIVEAKPNAIKPVQNYIEILKLPDSISENGGSGEGATENDDTEDDKTKEDNKNASEIAGKNQKNTFQAMFEEAIKRNETSRAHLFQIQRQAKIAELVKKAGSKKPQNNPLDLSNSGVYKLPEKGQLSPVESNAKLYINTSSPLASPLSTCSASSTSSTVPKTSPSGSKHSPSVNKRNILEIAHQLSKKSRLETTTSTEPPLKIPLSPKPSLPIPEAVTPPKQQVIVNNNFNSGGYLVYKRVTKKVVPPPLPKVPIPRLPIQKIPTPQSSTLKRNGNNGLLKFSNYTAKLATSNTPKVVVNPAIPNNNPINNIPTVNTAESIPAPSTMINGLTPNQFLEKFNITNLAQFNENCLQAQLAFQQACMVSQQFDMQRMQQQNSQKWMNNANMLWGYENYVQSLKKQQNQICGNASKN